MLLPLTTVPVPGPGAEDVLVAHGVLARAVRQRDAAAVEAAAARLQRELDEAVGAARQALAAPPLVRAS